VSRAEILAAITALAERQLDRAVRIEEAQRLVEDLALDSIGLLTLAVAVEDHFRIVLDEADEADIRTVGELVSTVERKLRG
jgi:acyl carrier protein